MATWKRLTRSTGPAEPIDVNMDAVAFMQGHTDHTKIYFAVSDGERLRGVNVKETPDQIHLITPMLPQAKPRAR
jgi:hypothetical protein